MKILSVSNFYPPDVVGGYEIGCRAILERLASRADVHVLTSFSAIHDHAAHGTLGITVEPVFEPCLYYSLNRGRGVQRFQLERAFAGYKTANVMALRSAIKRLRPDLIYLFNIMGLGPAGILEVSVESGVPTVCHLMDSWDSLFGAHSGTVNVTQRWVQSKARCAAIACSEFTLSSNSEIGEFGEATIIPGGVPFPKSLPPLRTDPLKRRFIYFGQLHRGKGVHKIIRAFQDALRESNRSGATLTIIGKGEPGYVAELHRLAASDPDGAEAIRFEPYMAKGRLVQELPAYDLAFCPLLPIEPFGYAAVESVACGLPVVISREMPLFSFVKSGQPEALTLRNANDVKGMSRIMAGVIHGKTDLAALRASQFACYAAAFDEARVVGERVYDFLSARAGSVAFEEEKMNEVLGRSAIYQRLLAARLAERVGTGVGQQTSSPGGRLVRLARCLENRLWRVERKFWSFLEDRKPRSRKSTRRRK